MSNLCKFCSFCEGQMTADAFANPATAFLLWFLDLKITQNLVHSSHFDLMWYIWLQKRLQDHNSLLKFGDKFQSEIRLFWLIWTSGRNGARQKVERGKNGICGGWLLGRLVGWVVVSGLECFLRPLFNAANSRLICLNLGFHCLKTGKHQINMKIKRLRFENVWH